MNATYTHSNNVTRKALFALLGLAMIVMAAGCDTYGLGDYGGYFDSGYYGFPSTSYYDPTYEIQSVNDYRQDVMDWSNAAWDDYILQ